MANAIEYYRFVLIPLDGTKDISTELFAVVRYEAVSNLQQLLKISINTSRGGNLSDLITE